MLKNLMVDASVEAGVNIFDKIFDWSILLIDQKKDSKVDDKPNQGKYISENQIIKLKNNLDGPKNKIDYANFRFDTFNDVKLIIYQAYSKRLKKKNKPADAVDNENEISIEVVSKKKSSKKQCKDKTPAIKGTYYI